MRWIGSIFLIVRWRDSLLTFFFVHDGVVLGSCQRADHLSDMMFRAATGGFPGILGTSHPEISFR